MPLLSGPGWLVVIAFAASLFARVEGGRLPYFMLYLSVAALAHVAWEMVSANSLSVSRRLSTSRCFAGQQVVLRTEVRNLGPLPIACLELRAGTPSDVATDGPPGAVLSLGPRQALAFDHRLVAARRGLYRWDDVEIRLVDALGLHRERRRFALGVDLLVYPRVVSLPGFSASEPRAHGQTHQKRRTPEDSDMLLGIRDYVDGDGLSRVHWKVSARTGELKSKEFARPGAGDALVALDLERRFAAGVEEDSVEEAGVDAAAALCNHFLTLGRRTGLVVAGRRVDVVPVFRGPEQLYKMLAALATAATGGELFAPAVLQHARGLAPGSTIVMVTPSTDPDLARSVTTLRAHGHRVTVVSIDRASFLLEAPPGDGHVGLDVMRLRLREMGARTIALRRGDDLPRALGAVPDIRGA